MSKLSAIRQTLINHSSERPDCEIKFLEHTLIHPSTPTSFSEIGIKVASQVFILQTYNVSAQMTEAQLYELDKLHGIDIVSMTSNVLYNENEISIEKAITKKYFELGDTNKDIFLSKWQKLAKKWFKLDFPIYVEDESKIPAKCMMASNMIASISRIGPANFIIVSNKIKNFIMDSPMFTFDEANIGLTVGIHKVGQFNGIKVLVDPMMTMNDNRILVGRTTKDNSPGTYLLENPPVITDPTKTLQDPSSNNVKVQLTQRRAVVSTRGAENSYITLNLEFKKKPLWRKLARL
jgi:hypothetical protein